MEEKDTGKLLQLAWVGVTSFGDCCPQCERCMSLPPQSATAADIMSKTSSVHVLFASKHSDQCSSEPDLTGSYPKQPLGENVSGIKS